jgi:hypothetical protein
MISNNTTITNPINTISYYTFWTMVWIEPIPPKMLGLTLTLFN